MTIPRGKNPQTNCSSLLMFVKTPKKTPGAFFYFIVFYRLVVFSFFFFNRAFAVGGAPGRAPPKVLRPFLKQGSHHP